MNTGTFSEFGFRSQTLQPHFSKLDSVKRALFSTETTYTCGDVVLKISVQAIVEERYVDILRQLHQGRPDPAYKALLDYSWMYYQKTKKIGVPDRESFRMTVISNNGTNVAIAYHHPADTNLPLVETGEYAFMTFTRPVEGESDDCNGWVFMVPRIIVEDPIVMGPKMAGDSWAHNTLYFATQPIEMWQPGGYSPRANKN